MCIQHAPPTKRYYKIININMGRYYNGDIEGKFWFGVQSSDDAIFFGGSESQSFINYHFSDYDQKDIEAGLKRCEDELGEYRQKLDAYFKVHDAYDNQELAEALDVTQEELPSLLEWFARLELGRKIHRCVKDTGDCSFEAEV